MLLEIVLKTYFPIGKEGRGGLGSMYRRLVFFRSIPCIFRIAEPGITCFVAVASLICSVLITACYVQVETFHLMFWPKNKHQKAAPPLILLIVFCRLSCR